MKLRLIVRKGVVLPIILYQHLLSPLKPSSCLYYPTCSSYTKEAVLRHGVLGGLLLGLLRLLRCFGLLFAGGSDPVPERITLRYLFGSYRTYFRYRKNRAV